MFPENDTQYEDKVLTNVVHNEHGWMITFDDGWALGLADDTPVEPKVGMEARLYGKGFGCPVRGLFLDEQQVYYRTEAEAKEYFFASTYGKDAAEWLARWDAGERVWSVEMGGLGPGYEQAIQIAAAEILRYMLDNALNTTESWDDSAVWMRDRAAIEAASFEHPVIRKLGLSGAQWGAAMSIASNLYRRGPIAALTDEAVKDRKIQVSKHFPNPYEE